MSGKNRPPHRTLEEELRERDRIEAVKREDRKRRKRKRERNKWKQGGESNG